MAKKEKRYKKVDVRKKHKKILQEKQKRIKKQDPAKHKAEKEKADKSIKTEKEEKLEVRLKKETHLYWVRAATGALSAFVGRLILGFIGWSLFIWMLSFWFGFPFLVSFIILRYKYDEEEWNWKNIIKPGIGIFFFLFMIVGVMIHTLLKF